MNGLSRVFFMRESNGRGKGGRVVDVWRLAVEGGGGGRERYDKGATADGGG